MHSHQNIEAYKVVLHGSMLMRCVSHLKIFFGSRSQGKRRRFGGIGTPGQASAQRTQASRGVWGHAPLGNFLNLDTHICNLVQSGVFKVTKFHIWN